MLMDFVTEIAHLSTIFTLDYKTVAISKRHQSVFFSTFCALHLSFSINIQAKQRKLRTSFLERLTPLHLSPTKTTDFQFTKCVCVCPQTYNTVQCRWPASALFLTADVLTSMGRLQLFFVLLLVRTFSSHTQGIV